jgi:hypothetical protein
MPYRRLPNTDQARVRALRTALEESDRQHLQLVIAYKTQHDAKVLLQKFEQAMGLYKQTYDNQVNSNRDFQQVFRNARLYISHFIQVLNLAVQREEIKLAYKKFYHLDPDDFSVPDMVSAESLIERGQNIIEGEAERLKSGGVPLYNPAIAKVKVHFDIFKDFRDNQLLLQQNTSRYADKVNELREPVDELIVDIWNQIEGFFSELPPYKRMETCKQYGVVYYYRKGEALLTPADDLPKPEIVAQEIAAEIINVVPEEMATSETLLVVPENRVEVEESSATAPVEQKEMAVEMILETMEEPVATTEELFIDMTNEKTQDATLFDEPDTEVTAQGDQEVKINEVLPKKRKKRNAKQDALLSLFLQ